MTERTLAEMNPCMTDGVIVHKWNKRPCGDDEYCTVCDRKQVSPHLWGRAAKSNGVQKCTRCGSRRVAPQQGAARSPIMDIEGTIRMAGYVREIPGYRVLISDIPVEVMRKYLVEHHEPDVRQISEAHVANALLGER